MKTAYFLLFAFLVLSILWGCNKENPASSTEVLTFTRTFGGSESDYASSVQQTTDGGYIVAGYTRSFGAGDRDGWLIKTNESGNLVWTQTFGGSNSDIASSIQQTTDGGYILAGRTKSFGAGDSDLWLIKTDASGSQVWAQTFGGSSSDGASSVQQTTDGGYIITGSTKSFGAGDDDLWLIKTDANGNQEWAKTFGGSSFDLATSVQQTTDGGYIVAGDTRSFGAGLTDGWLIQTDASGNQVWAKTFGGSDIDHAFSVRQTTDEGYIVAGNTESFGADDVWLIKTNASGNQVWTQVFGGDTLDAAYCVQQITDGGYIIAGETESYGEGGLDVWLIKTDASGNQVWAKTYGGSDWDYARFVQQTTDGGYIVAGITRSFGAGKDDGWLLKTNANGNLVIASN